MSVFDKGLITLLACDALFSLISIPLILRLVPRNPLYGFRTCATLRDDALWYKANAHFGWRFLIGNLLSAGAAAALHEFQGLSPQVYLKATIVLIAAPAIAAALLTARFIREESAGCRPSGGGQSAAKSQEGSGQRQPHEVDD